MCDARAAGEEFGWRGLLVPELARFMGFTRLALFSGAIWTAWHIPLILFGTYHGTGSVWYSLAVFVPSVMGAGLVIAWLRIISGSVWVAVLFHGFWNYFIQQVYPAMTVMTDAGEMMLGEFGVVRGSLLRRPCSRLLAPPGQASEAAGGRGVSSSLHAEWFSGTAQQPGMKRKYPSSMPDRSPPLRSAGPV
jgi:hypothetical protein